MNKTQIKLSPAQLKVLLKRKEADAPPQQTPLPEAPTGGPPQLNPMMGPPGSPMPMPGMMEPPLGQLQTSMMDAQDMWENIGGLGQQIWKSLVVHTPELKGDPETAFVTTVSKFQQNPMTIRDPEVQDFLTTVTSQSTPIAAPSQMPTPESMLQEVMGNATNIRGPIDGSGQGASQDPGFASGLPGGQLA